MKATAFVRVKEFLRKTDYRHYICAVITLVFLLCWTLFPNALGRLVESMRDFGVSLAYYVCELFGIEHGITPTVNDLPKVPFFDIPKPSVPSTPTAPIPSDWEQFKNVWGAYWRLWANGDNITLYLLYIAYYLLLCIECVSIINILSFVLQEWIDRYFSKKNNAYNRDSKPVQVCRWLTFYVYLPVKLWFKEFIAFVREQPFWWKLWLSMWGIYLNVITIATEFVAFYFYFFVTLDFLSIYRQFYKLVLDLKAPFTVIPLWAWLIAAYGLFLYWRRRIAYDRQDHMERQNCGFWLSRPIVSMLCATMGKGKTTMMTDGGLSDTVMQRNKAFEMLLENDLKFPYFPWIKFEKSIQRAMSDHNVYNLATARRFVRGRKAYYEKHPCHRNIWDYDYEHYGYYYDDKLKVVDVWAVLESYAQLYFMYVIHSAALIASYSVRVDDIMSDLGNFPRWNSDFFKRDSRLIDSFSRHAKIIDFNALRLGYKLGEDRTFADSFEFGTVLITEIGKERGNNLENREKKKSALETNQKNDGFDNWLKMVRHSATVDGHPFVRVITDEQRPESWGANARDLCEIVHIREKGEKRLSLPFFHLTELLYAWIFNKFAALYYQYRYVRSDNSLPMFLLKAFTAKVEHYYKHVYNQFGYHVLTGEVERGTQDGTVQAFKYYIQDKKIYAQRFSTDCFSDYFTVRALRSPVGLDDMPEYETEKATFEELRKQNSYFVNDLLTGLIEED